MSILHEAAQPSTLFTFAIQRAFQRAKVAPAARLIHLAAGEVPDFTTADAARWTGLSTRQTLRHLAELRRVDLVARNGGRGRYRRTLPASRRERHTSASLTRRAHLAWTAEIADYLELATGDTLHSVSLTFRPRWRGKGGTRSSEDMLAAVKGFVNFVKRKNEGRRVRAVAVLDKRGHRGERTRPHVYALVTGARTVLGRWWSHGHAQVSRVAVRDERGRGRVLRYASDKVTAAESEPLLL